MLRRSNKLSTVITIVISVLLLAALCVLAFWLPLVVESMINVTDNIGNRGEITDLQRTLVLIDAYAMLAVAVLAVILALILLREVLLERVFSVRVTRLISAISWCCFAEGLLFLLLGGFFQIAIAVAVAACFVGFCLRVVKNVIEEATRIKSENDFTI